MRNSGLMLYSCAGLLLSGGVILGGSTAWSLLRMSYYFWISDLGVELGAGVLIVTGSALCLPACWLATLVPQHPKSVPLASSLTCLLSVAMVLLGTGLISSMSLTHTIRNPAALNASMQRAMAYDDMDYAVRSSYASMQTELKCCGVLSHTDWHQHRTELPPSCCGRVWNGKNGEACRRPLYGRGCLKPALYELRAYLHSATTLGYSMIIILAITLIASTYTLVSEMLILQEAKQLSPFRIACLSPNNQPILPQTLQPLTAVSLLSPIAAPM